MVSSIQLHANSEQARRYWFAFFGILFLGLFLQLFLSHRSWVGGDQINLLRLGWSFVETGELLPFAKLKDGAGVIPGCFQQLLVGIPLKIVPHYQSPLAIIFLFDLLAGLLLFRVLQQGLGSQVALIFFALYWLSPWRLYHSGFLWEPRYMFLPAAVHLWACWHQRKNKSFWHSVALVTALVLAMQIHNSFFLLLLVTGLLLLKKKLRISIYGSLLGLLIGLLPLIPTLLMLTSGSDLPVGDSQGFFGASLLKVAPVLKGGLYWIRLGSLDIGTPFKEMVFFQESWIADHSGGTFLSYGLRLLQGLSILSLLISLRAFWWYFSPIIKRVWKRSKQQNVVQENISLEESKWFQSYAFSTFVGLLIAAALSPITLQGWMVIVVLHAACIPVAVWLYNLWSKRRTRFRWVMRLLLTTQVLLCIAIGVGNPIYRSTKELPEKLLKPENRSLIQLFPEKHVLPEIEPE